MGAGEDGDHHLRHVEPALVQGGDAPGRRAGPGDEPGGQGGAGQGRAHHPRPEQLHGSLQGPPGSQARQAAPKAANLPADIDGWCNKIPAEENGNLPDRPVRRRLRRRAAVPGGLALAVADRRDRDPRRGCHQRLGRRDLEPAGKPRDHQRHAHGRSHEHVRARPAVRAAAACPPRQERGPGPRPDRHHVQLAKLALRQPLRGHQPDHRAHREIRLPDDHLDRPDRPARVHVPARRPAPGRLRDRRGRVQDREDPAGLRARSSSRWACAARS